MTAWYPANGTINIANQTTELAYVLQAIARDAVYNESVTLIFSHQLAKIRVELTGEKVGDVKDVKIESYTSCTNTNGEVSTNGASVGEITMHRVDNIEKQVKAVRRHLHPRPRGQRRAGMDRTFARNTGYHARR